jgi:tRNA nucleotidyltransferase (CCA-adding enzyme)
VRILRLARFAARFADFSVAPETLALMRDMVAGGEVDHLVAERVWQELAKGLMEPQPSRMFEVLRECGALARLLPEVDALFGVPQRADYHPEIDTGVHTMMVVDEAARGISPCRYASPRSPTTSARRRRRLTSCRATSAMRHAACAWRPRLCDRLRVPNECRDLALLTARYHGDIHRAGDLRQARW